VTATFGADLAAALPRLRRYAIALAGDVATADDLLQDCMERAWKNQAAITDEGALFPWLRAILHNVNIDRIRRRRRRPNETESLDAIAETLAGSCAGDGPALSMDVIRAMKRLSFEHRQILLLVGVEGLSYREIADELGVPVGTVMSRLARARERLRALLEDQR
jgi:RNA polymerase sigma-70 factor (ECF subfamily)